MLVQFILFILGVTLAPVIVGFFMDVFILNPIKKISESNRYEPKAQEPYDATKEIL